MNPKDEALLDRLRGDATPSRGEAALESARQELGRLADPCHRLDSSPFRWPWSERAAAIRAAKRASRKAQLDVFLDDLNSIRAARQAISRVSALRAIEAAECAIFEDRAQAEVFRHSVLADAHRQITERFTAEIARLHGQGQPLSPEMADALRERALNELTESMKAVSRARAEFEKQWLLHIKE